MRTGRCTTEADQHVDGSQHIVMGVRECIFDDISICIWKTSSKVGEF